MISTKDKEKRRAVYARDGYRCALCDCTQYLQVHHVIPKGQGGADVMQNMICLCSRCHAQCHGIDLTETGLTEADMAQYCVEYLADLYAPDWNPWSRKP